MVDPKANHLLTATDIEGMAEHIVQHQFNDNAVRQTKTLTSNTGMQRIGIHLVRLGPGRDSTTHHYHDADEEFVYVLSGTGQAKIGDAHVGQAETRYRVKADDGGIPVHAALGANQIYKITGADRNTNGPARGSCD